MENKQNTCLFHYFDQNENNLYLFLVDDFILYKLDYNRYISTIKNISGGRAILFEVVLLRVITLFFKRVKMNTTFYIMLVLIALLFLFLMIISVKRIDEKRVLVIEKGVPETIEIEKAKRIIHSNTVAIFLSFIFSVSLEAVLVKAVIDCIYMNSITWFTIIPYSSLLLYVINADMCILNVFRLLKQIKTKEI